MLDSGCSCLSMNQIAAWKEENRNRSVTEDHEILNVCKNQLNLKKEKQFACPIDRKDSMCA